MSSLIRLSKVLDDRDLLCTSLLPQQQFAKLTQQRLCCSQQQVREGDATTCLLLATAVELGLTLERLWLSAVLRHWCRSCAHGVCSGHEHGKHWRASAAITARAGAMCSTTGDGAAVTAGTGVRNSTSGAGATNAAWTVAIYSTTGAGAGSWRHGHGRQRRGAVLCHRRRRCTHCCS